MKKDLTQQELMDVLSYDPMTGLFVWIVSPRNGWAGKVAGCLHSTGYIRIRINGRGYTAHQLAFLYMTGKWTEADIDHKDGDGSNNKWLNLRQSTKSQNKANSRSYKNNKSGIKGVCWNKHLDRWGASIQVAGKRHFLGLFHTKEEAAEAYMASAVLFFGEFARAA